MIRIFIVLMVLGAVMLSACNRSDKSKENHDMENIGKDYAQSTAMAKLRER